MLHIFSEGADQIVTLISPTEINQKRIHQSVLATDSAAFCINLVTSIHKTSQLEYIFLNCALDSTN